MKYLLKFLFIPALAVVGYFAGVYFPGSVTEVGSSGVSGKTGEVKPSNKAATDTTETDGALRDPRTGKTFAESKELLEKLGHQALHPGGAPYIVEGQRFGKAYLELERIFSLASKEEVLAFFAEKDLADQNGVLLAAAYGRLASLSLGDAKTIWTDHFERTGKGIGVERIVEVWVEQDAFAVEQWIDALPEGEIRDSALFTLLGNLMETSPETVEHRIFEVDGLFESIQLATALASNAEPDEFAPLAERFLSESRNKWQYQNQLVALLNTWGEKDSAAMMEWLMKKPDKTFQDHVVSRVAQARMKADPAAFVKGFGSSVADSESVGAMAGQGWLNWLKSGEDEKGALDYFQKYGEHLKLGGSSWTVFQEWEGADALRALNIFSALPESDSSKKMVQSILYILSEKDPVAALEYGQKNLPEGEDTDSFIGSALNRLAQQENPERALDWALANLNPGSSGQKQAIRWLMTTWSKKSPTDALARVSRLPEDIRKEAFSGIAYELAENSPDQLFDYLESAGNPDAVVPLARSSFWSFGYHKGGEAYLSRALALPGEKLKEEAISGLFQGWASSNLETSATALNGLESGTLKDAAISEFVVIAGGTDRESALSWSLAIGDPKKRREKAMDQARRWLKSDRPAAKSWIESSEKIPGEWKAILLKPED